MLLAYRDVLLGDPFAFVVLVVAVAVSLTIAITFHEFAHAFAANRLGDPTAARHGRLTLNPKAHLDPTGTIMLLIAGFGGGRPVPVDVPRLPHGRRGMAIVSGAGPASHLVPAPAFPRGRTDRQVHAAHQQGKNQEITHHAEQNSGTAAWRRDVDVIDIDCAHDERTDAAGHKPDRRKLLAIGS